jgi:hypothetical protein
MLPSRRPRESPHSTARLLIRLLSAFLSQDLTGSNPQELYHLICMPKGQAVAFGYPYLECLCVLELLRPEAGVPLSRKESDKRWLFGRRL